MWHWKSGGRQSGGCLGTALHSKACLHRNERPSSQQPPCRTRGGDGEGTGGRVPCRRAFPQPSSPRRWEASRRKPQSENQPRRMPPRQPGRRSPTVTSSGAWACAQLQGRRGACRSPPRHLTPLAGQAQAYACCLGRRITERNGRREVEPCAQPASHSLEGVADCRAGQRGIGRCLETMFPKGPVLTLGDSRPLTLPCFSVTTRNCHQYGYRHAWSRQRVVEKNSSSGMPRSEVARCQRNSAVQKPGFIALEACTPEPALCRVLRGLSAIP